MTSATARRLGRIPRSRRFREEAVLIRQAAGSRNEYGEWQPGDPTEADVLLASAPISGKAREQLPEGVRGDTLRTFWLREEVDAVEEGRHAGDQIRHDGTTYRIVMVRDWGGFREAHGTAQG